MNIPIKKIVTHDEGPPVRGWSFNRNRHQIDDHYKKIAVVLRGISFEENNAYKSDFYKIPSSLFYRCGARGFRCVLN
jgi:hypothetical protein